MARGADVLLITDGDADRMGIGDEQGRFLNQLQVFALLVAELRKSRGCGIGAVWRRRGRVRRAALVHRLAGDRRVVER